ncbi:hypothetical protein N7457_004990, partial [Penicillium paradoxum]|uniref:uncharacterized protein n=1 Tax=Penicillium paradoxum TaxID=176176 RepID=UPI002549A02F
RNSRHQNAGGSRKAGRARPHDHLQLRAEISNPPLLLAQRINFDNKYGGLAAANSPYPIVLRPRVSRLSPKLDASSSHRKAVAVVSHVICIPKDRGMSANAHEHAAGKHYREDSSPEVDVLGGCSLSDEPGKLNGRMHYGRALSSPHHALKNNVMKSPQKLEAMFIKLWLMLDYENRVGNVEVYFFTPAAIFLASPAATLNADICKFFSAETRKTKNAGCLTLFELYRMSKQSASRFWGGEYPWSARLDEMENLPRLSLHHRSHAMQFKIAELLKWNVSAEVVSNEHTQFQQIIDEINTIIVIEEYDTPLNAAKGSPSCELGSDGRRVFQMIHWASIIFHRTIVFFHLCFQDILNDQPTFRVRGTLLSLPGAASHVLELSLKFHHTQPRLMVRITWPLFSAGIATSDEIYKDWVSIQLRQLGRYGQIFSHIGRRFDEIIQGSYTYIHGPDSHFLDNSGGEVQAFPLHYVSTAQEHEFSVA